MRREERQQPLILDQDPYLEAYRKRQWDREVARERIALQGLSEQDLNGPVDQTDPYLEAASERFHNEPPAFSGLWTDQIEAAGKDFAERKRDAMLIVELAEKSGVEVPEDVRLRATAESAQPSIDAILAQRQQHRRAAKPTVGSRWLS